MRETYPPLISSHWLLVWLQWILVFSGACVVVLENTHTGNFFFFIFYSFKAVRHINGKVLQVTVKKKIQPASNFILISGGFGFLLLSGYHIVCRSRNVKHDRSEQASVLLVCFITVITTFHLSQHECLPCFHAKHWKHLYLLTDKSWHYSVLFNLGSK